MRDGRRPVGGDMSRSPRWLVRAFVHLLRTIRDHGTPLQFLSAVLGSERCPTEPKPKALTIAVRSNVNRAPFLKRNGASFMSIAERQRV